MMNNLEFNPSSTSDCISNAENSQVADESKIRVTVRAPKNKASAYSPSAKSESKGMSSKETVTLHDRLSNVCAELNWRCYEHSLQLHLDEGQEQSLNYAENVIDALEHAVMLKRVARANRLIKQSGLSEAQLETNYNPNLFSFSDNFDPQRLGELEHDENLFIRGEPGVGKTLTALQYAKRAIYEKGYSIYFAYSTELFALLRDPIRAPDLLNKVKNVRLLILDDVGHEDIYEGNTNAFYNIVAYRLNKQKSTIITSGTAVEQWASRFDDRKLFESTVTRFVSKAYLMHMTGRNLYL